MKDQESFSRVQVELIKTKIQVNNDDARALLLYGTIPLGIILFLLPILNVPAAPPLYRLSLLLSTIFLAYGAFAIIYYAREQIAWSKRTFGTFLEQLVAGAISEDSAQIKEFIKHRPHFAREGAFFRSAKLFVSIGTMIYGLLFVYGMFQSICFSTSFFENL